MLGMIMMGVGMMEVEGISIEKGSRCGGYECLMGQEPCAGKVAGVGMGAMIPLLLFKESTDMECTLIASPRFPPFQYFQIFLIKYLIC